MVLHAQCSLYYIPLLHIITLGVWFLMLPPSSPPRFGQRPDFFRIFATFPYSMSYLPKREAERKRRLIRVE